MLCRLDGRGDNNHAGNDGAPATALILACKDYVGGAGLDTREGGTTMGGVSPSCGHAVKPETSQNSGRDLHRYRKYKRSSIGVLAQRVTLPIYSTFQALHRVRGGFVGQRTRPTRAFLLERGMVCDKAYIPCSSCPVSWQLAPMFFALHVAHHRGFSGRLASMDGRIEGLSSEIETLASQDRACQRAELSGPHQHDEHACSSRCHQRRPLSCGQGRSRD